MSTSGSPWSVAGLKRKRQPLTDNQIAAFRQILLAKRRATFHEIQRLRREIGEGEERASDDPTKFRHIDEIDHQVQTQLIDREQQILEAVDGALQRIRDGTYGVCRATNRPIAIERLRAIPYADLCHDAEVASEEKET